jgi:putative ABC transport system permease protein
MRVALVGIGAGLFAAATLTRLMASLLYDVQPNDAAIFVTVALGMAAIAFVACCSPALRAARVDPALALRGE